MENLMDFDKNACLVCKIDQPAYFRTIYRLTEHQNKTRYIKYLLFSNNVAFWQTWPIKYTFHCIRGVCTI